MKRILKYKDDEIRSTSRWIRVIEVQKSKSNIICCVDTTKQKCKFMKLSCIDDEYCKDDVLIVSIEAIKRTGTGKYIRRSSIIGVITDTGNDFVEVNEYSQIKSINTYEKLEMEYI